jgi:outer membrane protein assembly factor BamD
MAAYAYYQADDSYDDAIAALDRFIELHPGNPTCPTPTI